MKFFSFLKSPKFWSTVIHLGIIGAGSFAAVQSGTPIPLVISSGLNALLPAPQDAGTPAPVPVVPIVPVPVPVAVVGK